MNEVHDIFVFEPGTWYLVPAAGYMCDTLADVNRHRPCVEGPCVTLGLPGRKCCHRRPYVFIMCDR